MMRKDFRSFWTVLCVCGSMGAGCDSCTEVFDGGDPPTTGGGVGDPCEGTGECRSHLICADDSTCQPSGTGVEGTLCELTGECADGLYCGPARSCAPAGSLGDGGDCQDTADCERGLICIVEGFGLRCRPGGSVDLGDACAGERDCLAGLACLGDAPGASLCTSPGILAGTDGAVTPPTLPYWLGVACGEEPEGVALFDVPRAGVEGDFYRLPYPNDARRTDAGLDLSSHPSPGTVLPIDIIDRYLRASEEDLRGFATNPTIYFRFSEPYDSTSLDGAFRLVDITPTSPDFGSSIPAAWLWSAGPISKYICEDWFAIQTPRGRPLRPETTYAAILDVGIATADSQPFGRSADFDAMLSDTAPTDSALAHAWDAYAPLRAYLSSTSTDASTVLNATVFTTQDPHALIPALRAVIRASDAPTISELTLCDGIATSPCDDGTEQRACGTVDADFHELHGKILLPIFQQGTPPFEEPEDGGGIAVDSSGIPTVARMEEVCFALTVPKIAPPTAGFPLMVHAHGTGGSMTGAVRNGLAKDVAHGTVGTQTIRAATLGIDLPQHGSRRGDSDRSPDVLFFNFANPRAARDNIAQGSADLFSLIYWATLYGLDASSSPTGEAIAFDPSRIVLFAHSQGASHASLMIPYESDLSAALLSGNGGDLRQSLLNKTQPVDIASVLPFALLDVNREGRLPTGIFHPALALFQSYFEAVDPVNFGQLLHLAPPASLPGHHVFMTYGPGDTFSPEPTMQAYSTSAALALVRPQLLAEGWGLFEMDGPLSGNVTVDGSPWTMGLRQYNPPAGVDGHFVATRSDDGRRDATRFVLMALDGQVPEIGGI